MKIIKAFKYYKKIIIEKNDILNQEIIKTFIVKKKESQFARKIIDEIEYIIFENKIKKDQSHLGETKINYNIIARNTKSKDLKFYFLNSIEKYHVVMEVEKVVKMTGYSNKKINSKYLKSFLDIFLQRIENPKEKFLNYVNLFFGESNDQN